MPILRNNCIMADGNERSAGNIAMEPVIREITVKSVLTKSNLPVSDYSVNPYVGCTHACRYCYASFMKRFTGHPEPWGTFLDVKHWPEIRRPELYAGKELFIGSVTYPYLPQKRLDAPARCWSSLQAAGSGSASPPKATLCCGIWT